MVQKVPKNPVASGKIRAFRISNNNINIRGSNLEYDPFLKKACSAILKPPLPHFLHTKKDQILHARYVPRIQTRSLTSRKIRKKQYFLHNWDVVSSATDILTDFSSLSSPPTNPKVGEKSCHSHLQWLVPEKCSVALLFLLSLSILLAFFPGGQFPFSAYCCRKRRRRQRGEDMSRIFIIPFFALYVGLCTLLFLGSALLKYFL